MAGNLTFVCQLARPKKRFLGTPYPTYDGFRPVSGRAKENRHLDFPQRPPPSATPYKLDQTRFGDTFPKGKFVNLLD